MRTALISSLWTHITPLSAQRDYGRIENAIRFIEAHYHDQPSLDEVAAAIHLSPHHFQRLFTRWAGVSPKQFMRFLTVEHAKAMLEQSQSVLDTSFDSGLSGPGRLHDLFVTFEAATPGEYKRGGDSLEIRYGFHVGPFGEFLLAQTARGLCGLAFVIDGARRAAIEDLDARWPAATLRQDQTGTSADAQMAFPRPGQTPPVPLKLWAKGTNFQIKVWEALLRLPAGQLSSYGAIARAVGQSSSARAVGRAVAENPMAYLIPCHRVIRASGRVRHRLPLGDRPQARDHWLGSRPRERRTCRERGRPVAVASEPNNVRIVRGIQPLDKFRAPGDDRPLVDVAFVGDLAGFDRRWLGHQEHPRYPTAAGRIVGVIRIEPAPERRDHLWITQHRLDGAITRQRPACRQVGKHQ